VATTTRPVETLGDTHGLVTRPGTTVWASSEGHGWRSVFASAQRESPFEVHCAPVADHLVVIHLSGPVRVTRTLAGLQETRMVPPGGSFIMPGLTDFGVRLQAPLDTLHFYLRRQLVTQIAEELAPGQRDVQIIPDFGAVDPFLEQIGLCLREQLRVAGEATALYVEHLAGAAAARLIRSHSSASPDCALPRVRPGLAAGPLQRTVDYIEANLADDISLGDLAAVSGLSAVTFARQFKRSTGEAPHQYLLRARAERARRLLSIGTLPIAAIALDCGFCHQEHMTRVFRKRFGVTPGAFRALSRG
jgi:AraC family transcriptional regulator